MKPCPFCSSIENAQTWNGSHYFVQCYSCGCAGPHIASFDEKDREAIKQCIDKWNQFTPNTKDPNETTSIKL
jgi:Zn ribbon nucleic-acid-binding protein